MKIRILSILLVLIMTFTLSVGVMAEGTDSGSNSNVQTAPGGSSEGGENTDTGNNTGSVPDGDKDSDKEGDETGSDTPTEQKSIKVEVSKTQFFRDAEALVTVSFTKNSGIKQFSFEITYDTENLEYTGFSLDKSVFTGVTVLNQNPIQIVGSAVSNTDATGIVLSLKFKAKENAKIKNPNKIEINKSASYVYNILDAKAKFEVESGYAMLVCKTHAFGENEHLEPTCTEKGYDKKVCTVCGDEQITEIDAKGHSVLAWQEISASTCAIQGEHQGECLNCKTMIVEKLPLNDHFFGDWIEYLAPTLDSLGEARRICANCEFEELRSIPKLITGITDPESGVTLLGNNGITFYGDTIFSARQTFFKDVDQNEKNRIKSLVQSLVGKQPYSKYSVKFADVNGNPIELGGTVTVSLPINSELKGVVIVGVINSYITVLNANIDGALATFTVGTMPDEFIVLYEEQGESIVKTFQNIFADDEGNVSTAGKVAGWVIMILIALVLLGISAMLILIGVHQQKKKERLEAGSAVEIADNFEMEQHNDTIPSTKEDIIPQTEENAEGLVGEDDEYDEAVRQMVQDWFDEQ